MAEIQAFRGWRYNLGQVGSLSDVVAPPYDVIGPDLQTALYKRHPCNVIRLILNRQEPGDESPQLRYQRAARFLRQWKQDDVLVEEGEPALYVYHQTFEVDGRTRTRKGFMARVRLAPLGQGGTFPHEETMPGPKADRLQLLEATATNLSPIFALYPDPDGEVQAVLQDAVARQIPLEATDHLGVVHQLWPVSGQRTISRVAGLMGPRPLFIADGHHRYETALAYRDRLQAAGSLAGPDDPAQFMLTMLVGMSDAGLAILPTHRLLDGIGEVRGAWIRERLGGLFEWLPLAGGTEAAWEAMQADGSQALLGFGTAADGRWQLGRLVQPEAMTPLAPQHSVAWRGLGVSLLQELVFRKLGVVATEASAATTPACGGGAGMPSAKIGGVLVRYVHTAEEVESALAGGDCQVACLVQPAGLEDLQTMASAGEKMPAKSTYFYPKLLSGLVLNPLRRA